MTLTNLLVLINVVAYVWLISTGGLATNRALFDHGALLGVAAQSGEWWRIVTGGFLHGGLTHIGFNMLALFYVGNDVERLFGKARFALLYAISLIGSGLVVVYFSPEQLTVGASGAIFGLFGALVAVGLRLGSHGRTLIGRVLPVVGINLVLTFTIPNISASGHIGGLITGFFAGLVLFMLPSRQRDAVYAYAFAGADEPARETIEQPAQVETIEHPPAAGPHEKEDAPALEVRDPRE